MFILLFKDSKQPHLVSKEDLALRNPKTWMTAEEEAFSNYLKKESDGYVKLDIVQDFLKQAYRLRADWLSCGLTEKRPNSNNRIYLAS